MVMDGALYIGSTLLASGRCSLWPDDKPAAGSILGGTHGLLNYDQLKLQLASGETLDIRPRRIEYSAGRQAILIFDVVPGS
jgi:hypothetical protein